jgi:hypothetical protein
MLPDLLVLAGILLTQLFLTVYGALLSVTENRRKKTAIIFVAVGSFGLLLTVISGFRSAMAQSEIQGALTGGTMRPYIKPEQATVTASGQVIVTATLTLIGKYPLHDVSYRIFSDRGVREWNPGSVYPNMVGRTVDVPEFEFNDKTDKEVVYKISIAASNGNYFQQIRFAKVDDRWIHALKLEDEPTRSLLYEDVDRGFPTKADGQVDWLKER